MLGKIGARFGDDLLRNLETVLTVFAIRRAAIAFLGSNLVEMSVMSVVLAVGKGLNGPCPQLPLLLTLTSFFVEMGAVLAVRVKRPLPPPASPLDFYLLTRVGPPPFFRHPVDVRWCCHQQDYGG